MIHLFRQIGHRTTTTPNHEEHSMTSDSQPTSFQFEGVKPGELVKVSETKVKYEQMGDKGQYLKVYESYMHGKLVSRRFTLQSLAECLGMPKGMMEGRYARGRLHRWKQDIHTGQSRPVRGFDYDRLAEVITVLKEPKMVAEESVSGSYIGMVERPGPGAKAPLRYVTKTGARNDGSGARYITVQALADHYGVSITTIRNKLSRAGMFRLAEDIAAPLHGGRPKRGWNEKYLEQLVDAIEHGAQYLTHAQTVLATVERTRREEAQRREALNQTPLTFTRASVEEQMEALERQMAEDAAKAAAVGTSVDAMLAQINAELAGKPGLPGGNSEGGA